MFRNAITETPLTTQAANDYFSNITGTPVFGDDTSFIATLRALLASRMGKDDEITFTYTCSNYQASQIARRSVKDALAMVFQNYAFMQNRFCLHNIGSYAQQDNNDWMDFIQKHFEKTYPGWVRVEKMTLFFQQRFKLLAYINPEIRGVQLFVAGLNHKYLHFLQCSILAVLPWYFDPAKGVTPLEMELINSLKETKSDKYESCIEKIAAQFDLRSGRIRKLLDGFDTKFDRSRLAQCQSEVENIQNNIASLERDIRNYLRQKAEKDAIILGLMAKISNPEGGSDITDYFLCNKRLSLRSVDDESLEFVVMDYITYFDEDAAKKFIDNQRSVLYNLRATPAISQEDMKLLLRAIFVDQKLRVRVCAAYRIYLYGSVEARAGFRYGSECREYTPNPHIDGYHCLGNHRQQIEELLNNHEYIGAIEQCISSCKSLNFCDPTVMQFFAKRLYGSDTSANVKCIELPDGSVVEPKEAIAWIKEQQAAAEAPAAPEAAAE